MSATPHARRVDLDAVHTRRSSELPEALRPPAGWERHGDQVVRGFPFRFGPADGLDVILLEREAVTVPLDGTATYVLVVHAVADDEASGGRAFAGDVSRYVLVYDDGQEHATPVHRRFGIQQARVAWGASAAAAVPAAEDVVRRRVRDELAVSGSSTDEWGFAETQVAAARDAAGETLWLYALPNPRPEAGLQALRLEPGAEASAVYAVSLTTLAEHPLRPARRRTLRLRVPDGARRNALGELEGVVDRPRLGADHAAGAPVRRRRLAAAAVRRRGAGRGRRPPGGAAVRRARGRRAAGRSSSPIPAPDARVVPPAERPVRVRIVDAGGLPVAARLHLHGEDGQYLPPRGHHRQVNTGWFEDWYGELAIDRQQYAYVDGRCVVDLPLGTVHVEISRGYEVAPLRRTVEVTADTEELTFTLERVLRWREQGWVTADTHVHFLSPQTALLEGRAEGVNVVNLLASQWGEMFSNVGDFDGATTLGARELGGDGEFLVRVGTENRQQVLGHISLLGYAGRADPPAVHRRPVRVGARRSARGGDGRVGRALPGPGRPGGHAARARSAARARRRPRARPGRRRRADELQRAGRRGAAEPVRPGRLVPLPEPGPPRAAGRRLGQDVGRRRCSAGSGPTPGSADRELGYEAWMDAVRRGDTFVTVGPLVSLEVEGVRPGGRLELPAGGGRVRCSGASSRSRSAPSASRSSPAARWPPRSSSTARPAPPAAPRSRSATRAGSRCGCAAATTAGQRDVAAHTSAVLVTVGGRPHLRVQDAADVLDQIQGAIAYVDTLATRADVRRHQRLRSVLEGAYTRLHQRLHAAGSYHRHPLHDPAEPHEH